jgi:hypothetical protein
MTPEEQKEVLDLLDVRVTILAAATRTTPAKVRIEGVVYDHLLSEEKAVRDLAQTSSRKCSAPSQGVAAGAPGSLAHP